MRKSTAAKVGQGSNKSRFGPRRTKQSQKLPRRCPRPCPKSSGTDDHYAIRRWANHPFESVSRCGIRQATRTSRAAKRTEGKVGSVVVHVSRALDTIKPRWSNASDRRCNAYLATTLCQRPREVIRFPTARGLCRGHQASRSGQT